MMRSISPRSLLGLGFLMMLVLALVSACADREEPAPDLALAPEDGSLSAAEAPLDPVFSEDEDAAGDIAPSEAEVFALDLELERTSPAPDLDWLPAPDTAPDFVSPPPGDFARGGYRIPSGFWQGWYVRTHSHDNCGTSPCCRFIDHGSYGGMRARTQGVYYLNDPSPEQGAVSMRIRFHNGQLGVNEQGRHLIGISSRPLIFTPRDIGLSTWTRIDLDRPENGRIRAVIFNNVNGVALNGGRWPTRWFNVPFAVERWADVQISWRLDGRRLTLTINGQSGTFDLLSGSEAPGKYLALGNMDPIQGEIDFASIGVASSSTRRVTDEAGR